ncbi:PLP-dependent transferase [Ascobolus immersus RN42]|uniref:Molybdenum cofactor sulfurase n=1 Tax=Ascobolus immersus RN42 TaxID=1160509 RepID=A0A3N4I5R8_ASCIM|nr:PLP-dependent transferase [Ascobolus immersus RN42]
MLGFTLPTANGTQTNGSTNSSANTDSGRSKAEFVADTKYAGYNAAVEEFRPTEYPQLNNVTYLDHAGTTPYSASLITTYSTDLLTNLYGNPHSQSLSSLHTSKRIDDVRLRVLRLFNADPREFELVFVANATGGMKLVVEALTGKGSWRYWYHGDAHTSLVGVRECAQGGACLDSDDAVEHWLETPEVEEGQTGLFAWPAQSNFSGRRTPTHWAGKVRQRKKNTYTLLDAAALVTTSPLDLSNPAEAPDFTVLSFYKMFGFPDLGGLIVRKECAPLFQHRRYFGGGTVEAVVSRGEGDERFHAKRKNIHATLEDGTLPFHSILALDIAIATHTRLYGSFGAVSAHTIALAKWLYDQLANTAHTNGAPLLKLYSQPPETGKQGAILTFNLLRPDGSWVGYSEVEKLAAVKNIHIRTGGLCNPGGIEQALDLQPWEVKSNYDAGHRCWDERDIVRGKPTGAIRVSLGACTTFADVERVREFLVGCYKDRNLVKGTWGRKTEAGNGPKFAWMNGVKKSPSEEAKEGRTRVEIQEIRVYPIKSCAGFEVPRGERWELMETGLRFDREWCLVHVGTQRALDQKRFPRMALIKTSINLAEGVLIVTTPATSSQPERTLKVPVEEYAAYTSCPTRLCGESITTDTYTSPEITDFFSSFLDTPCTLSRHSKTAPQRTFQGEDSPLHKLKNGKRKLSPSSSDEDSSPPQETSTPITLANESPLLLSTSASLTSISTTLDDPLSPKDFRANLHLTGPFEAYTEESWHTVVFEGGCVVKCLGRCRRCRMIAVDQNTGEAAGGSKGGAGQGGDEKKGGRGKVYEAVVRDRGGYWGVLGGVRSVGWVRSGEGGWAS